MRTIFDFELKPDVALFDSINARIESAGGEYHRKYGMVGAPEWWASIKDELFVLEGPIISFTPSIDEHGAKIQIPEVETDKAVIELSLPQHSEEQEILCGQSIRLESVTLPIDQNDPESGLTLDLKLCVS